MTRLSVVVANYQRPRLVERLLRQLDRQSLDPTAYELIVVDDGSREPVAHHLERVDLQGTLRVLRQANAGAAAARDRGARAARGEILVFLDDDMQVGPYFLERHLRHHADGRRVVVLGRMEADPGLDQMPLFERFHARQLAVLERSAREGGRIGGLHLYTGNVSLRRDDYLASGGFDPSLLRSEDKELGVRLEKLGVSFVYDVEASSVHSSDHTSLEVWLDRAYRYGVYDLAIARKHPDYDEADPWEFLFLVSPLSRPFLLMSAGAPQTGWRLSRVAMRVAEGLDRFGLERVAIAGTTFAFGVEYFRGLGEASGGPGAALSGLAQRVARRRPQGLAAFARRIARDVRADHDALRANRGKYHGEELPKAALGRHLVEKIGLQLLAGIRVMQASRDLGVPLAPRIVSRLLRHLYGSDVHWDARLAPGLVVVHGMGLAVSHGARVAPGCVLFQNVCLGEGIDPDTREIGAPTLEENVHVGPGATLLGPITIGRGSKIMAGAVVMRSVPPDSLVATPAPEIVPRRRRPGPSRRRDPDELRSPVAGRGPAEPRSPAAGRDRPGETPGALATPAAS